MRWPSPWGEGFPGWHIECSAMGMKYLGDRFDIHTGGIDLKFPHHEDEIAQSDGATGHQVITLWMHGEFLTLADAKMAKSAGNIIRVSELPEKGFQPLDFRYLALTAHYRSKLDFTEAAMHAAASGLARLRRAVAEGASDQTDGASASVDLDAAPMSGYRDRFVAAISDDLGTPAALATAHAVASADDLAPAQRRGLLLDFDRVLGLSLDQTPEPSDGELPEGAAALLEQRAAARAARDYATSDRLRDELAALGIEVRDTPAGQVATLKRN
jgi:cysteinyl-tRNA synthetase